MSGPAVPPYQAYADRPTVEQQYASGALEQPEGGDLPSESFGRLFAEQKARDAKKRDTMRQYLIYGGMAIAVVAVIVAVVYASSRFRRPL